MGVIVHATDIGDLQPVPIVLARERQLRFGAEGEASGAFEITLFLIDGNKREGEPAMLDRICATPAPLPGRGRNSPTFTTPAGGALVVSPEAIAQTFGAAGVSVKLVVLNACFTEPIAEACWHTSTASSTAPT